MAFLTTFAPWIVFAACTPLGWAGSAGAAAAVGLAVVIVARLRGSTADALVLELGSTVYLAVLTGLAIRAPHSGLRPYSAASSLAWLALLAWATLAARRPFTLGIARRSVPRELWSLPGFLQVNIVITRFWAITFSITAAAMAAAVAAGAPLALVIGLQVAGFVIPVRFTLRYPDRARARATSTHGLTEVGA